MPKLKGWIQDRETGAFAYHGDRADVCEYCEQAKHACECGEYAPHQCPCPICEVLRDDEDGYFIPFGAVAPF